MTPYIITLASSIIPHFLSGVLWPVHQMPVYLQWIAKVLPLTYAVDGLRGIMLEGKGILEVGPDLGILLAFAVVMVFLATLTLKRGAAG